MAPSLPPWPSRAAQPVAATARPTRTPRMKSRSGLMLLESPEFAPILRAARFDAYRDMELQRRQDRITVRGQIRIEPRRTHADAEVAANETRRPAAGKIIRGAKRDHVVKKLAETLDASRRAPFEFEGSCRHGVRA